jgi:hypothetical protein
MYWRSITRYAKGLDDYDRWSSDRGARPLLSPKVFQVIRQGTPGVIRLRTAKISFCNAIPRSPIFLVAQRVSYLAAFHSMPAKLLRWIHGPSPGARVFSRTLRLLYEWPERKSGQNCTDGTVPMCHIFGNVRRFNIFLAPSKRVWWAGERCHRTTKVVLRKRGSVLVTKGRKGGCR